MTLSIRSLTPRIGAEVSVDAATLLGGRHAPEFRRHLEERGVIAIRGLNLTNDEQLQFARTLGEVVPQGEEGIQKVSLDKKENPKADYIRGAFYWHIDGATDDVPTWATFLTARKLAPEGGHTEFANTYAAWDDLPAEEKKGLEKLRVVHSLEAVQRMVTPEPTYAQLTDWQRLPPKVHPLVWHHRSGRKSLVLGATASHVEGMSLEEGRALLCHLREWSTQPQFVYHHRWTVGDLVVWDNTGTMHRVTHYAIDSGRMMSRTTLFGEEALA